jgi:hypothetical protein
MHLLFASLLTAPIVGASAALATAAVVGFFSRDASRRARAQRRLRRLRIRQRIEFWGYE